LLAVPVRFINIFGRQIVTPEVSRSSMAATLGQGRTLLVPAASSRWRCIVRYSADERPRIAFDRHTVNGNPEMDKPMSDLEEILNAL
jgi:hypothetical protein